MSSTSQFDVLLSEPAKNYLLSLPEKDARAVAVHLLTFFKNATPPDSRAMTVLEGEKNDRIWVVGPHEILYRFLPEDRRVEIGVIRPTQTSK